MNKKKRQKENKGKTRLIHSKIKGKNKIWKAKILLSKKIIKKNLKFCFKQCDTRKDEYCNKGDFVIE